MNARPLILLIDDEAVPLRVRKMLLESEGYRVLIAEDAEAGLQLLRDHDVDLLITDHVLPDKDGCEIAAEAKQAKPGVPVLIFSGTTDRPDRAGDADGFLTKGCGPEEFLRTVRRVLKQSA